MDNGGKVTMIYRRTKKEMPVGDDEIKALLEEGIELIELAAPLSISSSNSKLYLKCTKMKLGDEDESGRGKPIPIEKSEFHLDFDTIITAIGQDIVLDFIEGNKLNVNSVTNETQIPNVFAGGDFLRGADSLINAMGDGRKVAEIIIQRSIEDYKLPEIIPSKKISLVEFQRKQSYREFGTSLPEIGVDERSGFELVHPVLDEEAAKREAERCLFCEDICNICIGVCPNFSNVSFDIEPTELPVWEATLNGDDYKVEKIDTFIIKQRNQIFNIGDFCNECGNCDTFCPTNGAPYKTKPHFYLTEDSFYCEETGYYLSDNFLKFKTNGRIESLTYSNNGLTYETDEVVASFSEDDFSLIDIKTKSDTIQKINFKQAVEMYFLLKNLKNFSIFK
jgi:putative selenate reductase